MPRPLSRSRSLSCYPHHPASHRPRSHRTARSYSSAFFLQAQPTTIASLDLPNSLPLALISLRNFLLGHVQQVEERLRMINSDAGFDSDCCCVSSSDDELDGDDDHQDKLPARHLNDRLRFQLDQSPCASIPPSSHLQEFVQQVSNYVNQLKSDLFKPDDLSFPSDTEHSPPGLLSLSSLVCPSLPQLKLKERFDCVVDTFSIPDANQLMHLLTIHSVKIQEVLSQLSLFSQYPARFTIQPLIPTIPNLASVNSINQCFLPQVHHAESNSEAWSNPSSLRQYFAAESDRLASLLPAFPTGFTESLAQSSSHITSTLRAYKEEAQAALHDGEVFIREEGEKLKGWVDSETESLRLALQAGASRLLTYHELPPEWKNNRFIISGYRFIPLDRWHHLLLSGLQWHNETINIHTHFFGTLSLIYLLCFLWPTTAHTDPASSTFTDRLISLIFLICAIKCLVCSTAWHLFAGCGTLGPFRRLACVDYVGISGLIAASVVSAEYYGFYCRPELAACYIGFTAAMGVIGMILPFQPFFDRPESKGIRIVFFVSMACSFLIPQAHMSYLYGLRETFNFYKPAIPSVISYLSGLFFYASNWPERIRPGWVFDTLFHSHQFWHVAIVVAIWLHWKAIGFLHDAGRQGFSCSAEAREAAGNIRHGIWGLPFNELIDVSFFNLKD